MLQVGDTQRCWCLYVPQARTRGTLYLTHIRSVVILGRVSLQRIQSRVWCVTHQDLVLLVGHPQRCWFLYVQEAQTHENLCVTHTTRSNTQIDAHRARLRGTRCRGYVRHASEAGKYEWVKHTATIKDVIDILIWKGCD